jgi:hypothetical protein
MPILLKIVATLGLVGAVAYYGTCGWWSLDTAADAFRQDPDAEPMARRRGRRMAAVGVLYGLMTSALVTAGAVIWLL